MPRLRLPTLVLIALALGGCSASGQAGESGPPAAGVGADAAAGGAASAAPASAAEKPRTPRRRSGSKDPAAAYRVAAKGTRFAVAGVRANRAVRLRDRPGGKVVARVGARTRFDSPQTLAVVKIRGRWLGVTSEKLPNGRLGWVDARSRALVPYYSPFSIRVDLSARRLELRRGRKIVQRMSVAIGRAGHETPAGRFAVTDKLPGSTYGASYGCCIVALSATQPNLPAGWPGGDRIAIHGTFASGSVGSAASTGCLRARNENLRGLMRRVPLGTPVVIRM